MAKSIDYWHNTIITEKETFASLSGYLPGTDSWALLLSDLKSSSKVSRWRLFVWCCAVCAYSVDVMFTIFQIDIATLISKAKYGTLPWYTVIAKEFQDGDTLIFNGQEYAYPVLNPANQIVQRASAKKATGTVIVKIAKVVAGVNTPLAGPEETRFLIYMDMRMPPGIMLNLINTNPDEIKAAVKVIYDPLVLDGTGQSIAIPGSYPAEEAAAAYINDLNNAFDGLFRTDKFIDRIQQADGVVDVFPISFSGRSGTDPFVGFAESYEPYAGHMKVAAGFPLNGSFVYQSA